ncbi:hypothetical protein HYW21_00445 [Candidatus Woesearchaeota archaeon]|nr:hypothetical protein [Candidatus Woesearchaeota archaeon]
MSLEDEARKEWKEKIRRKTEQVRRDWTSESDGSVPLEEALVGVLADYYVKREVPRVVIKYSEGATDEGLIKVFDKILGVMRTPTYHTLNYTNPGVVELAKCLCLRHSITGGDHVDRDATHILWEFVGDRPIDIYWDQERDLPQYSGEVLKSLEIQFGNFRVWSALRQHKEFSRMLGESSKRAYDWKRRDHVRNGTMNMEAKSRIELGFAQLADFFPEQSGDNVDQLFYRAVSSFVSAKNREMIPYRLAQYQLREIPVTMGINPVNFSQF